MCLTIIGRATHAHAEFSFDYFDDDHNKCILVYLVIKKARKVIKDEGISDKMLGLFILYINASLLNHAGA